MDTILELLVTQGLARLMAFKVCTMPLDNRSGQLTIAVVTVDDTSSVDPACERIEISVYSEGEVGALSDPGEEGFSADGYSVLVYSVPHGKSWAVLRTLRLKGGASKTDCLHLHAASGNAKLFADVIRAKLEA